jgi:hypothetical protein
VQVPDCGSSRISSRLVRLPTAPTCATRPIGR